MQYVVGYEKLVHVMEHPNLRKVGYREQHPRRVVEKISFQQYHVETFVNESQDFCFVLQEIRLSKKHLKFLENF